MNPLSKTTSNQIRVLRVLCIFFMMFVHVNPGLDAFLGQLTGALKYVHLTFGSLFGRASVPALTIISGLLIVNEMRRKPYLKGVRTRFFRILIPMAFWNLLIILVSLAIFYGVGAETKVFEELAGLSIFEIIYSRIFSVDYGAASTALNFLRDIFVCALFYLPVEFLMRRKAIGIPALVIIWIVGIVFGFAPIIYREHIFMFYCLGIFVALHWNELPVNPAALGVSLIGFLFFFTVESGLVRITLPENELVISMIETIKRVVISYLAVALSLAIAKRPSIGQWFYKVEPNIYLVFLGHMVVFLVMWGVWQQLFGTDLNFPYLAFYLLSPVIWLLASFPVAWILNYFPGWMQTIIRGKVFRPRSAQPKGAKATA